MTTIPVIFDAKFGRSAKLNTDGIGDAIGYPVQSIASMADLVAYKKVKIGEYYQIGDAVWLIVDKGTMTPGPTVVDLEATDGQAVSTSLTQDCTFAEDTRTIAFLRSVHGNSANVRAVYAGNGIQIDLTQPTVTGQITSDGGVKGLPTKTSSAVFSMASFGVVATGADCRAQMQAAIDAVHLAGGGRLVGGGPASVYGINVVARPGITHRPGVVIDLNGATIQRLGSNFEDPLIEGRTSFTLGGTGTEFGLHNGTINGTGPTEGVSDQGANFLYFGAYGAVRIGTEGPIISNDANGDGAQFRATPDVVTGDVTIGDYGRNGMSPTSGRFHHHNLRILGNGLPGANPGIAYDAENDGSTESGLHIFDYVEAEDLTFVDFFASSGGTFGQSVIIKAGIIGPSFKPLRFLSTSITKAGTLVVGPDVRVLCGGNNGTGIEIKNVTHGQLKGVSISKGTATGTSRGVAITGSADSWLIDIEADADLSVGFEASLGGITNSVFRGNLDSVYLSGCTNNVFTGAIINNLTLNGTGTNGNVFAIDCVIANIFETNGGLKSLQAFNKVKNAFEIAETETASPAILNLRGRNLFSAQIQGRVESFPDNPSYYGHGASIDFHQTGSVDTCELRLFTSNGGAGRVERLRVDFTGNTHPVGDNLRNLGTAAFRWKEIFAGTGAVNTSDEREKEQIGGVPDEWLDAWADVNWIRYRFKDAAAEKGDDARWHIGLVAQKIEEVFEAHGLNAFEIGLLCFDAWDERTEPVIEVRNNPETGEDENYDTGETRVVLEAGDRYGVRYDEAQAMEAAWSRREIARLSARVGGS
jgi:hypothetical protein